MRGALRLGRILGIPIAVNYTWFIAIWIGAWSLAGSYYPERAPGFDDTTYWIMGIASALLLFASVLVHEFGHALTARRFGIRTRVIVLFLFGGVAQIVEEPATPRAEFLVALAGPATSLALAASLHLISPAFGIRPLGIVVQYLAYVNLMLAVFNLVPGFPLDGGRVLRAALWRSSGSLERATRTAARTGQVIAMLFIGAGLLLLFRSILAGLWLVLIGWVPGHRRAVVVSAGGPSPGPRRCPGGRHHVTRPPRDRSQPDGRACHRRVLPALQARRVPRRLRRSPGRHRDTAGCVGRRNGAPGVHDRPGDHDAA
jgi:Zn-dependent protease